MFLRILSEYMLNFTYPAHILETTCETPRFFADFENTTLLWLHALRLHRTQHKHHEYNFR